MILTVYLSDGEQAVTEVPITPETTCRDVVEFCKEPGESGCHLAEVWRGNGKNLCWNCVSLVIKVSKPINLLHCRLMSAAFLLGIRFRCHVRLKKKKTYSGVQVIREGEVIWDHIITELNTYLAFSFPHKCKKKHSIEERELDVCVSIWVEENHREDEKYISFTPSKRRNACIDKIIVHISTSCCQTTIMHLKCEFVGQKKGYVLVQSTALPQ